MGTKLGKLTDVKRCSMEDINRTFAAAAKELVEFVLCIVPKDKPKDIHEALKLAERRFQIAQQSITTVTASTFQQSGGRSAGTLMNVLAKTNQKLGGLNYEPKVAEPIRKWFESGVMYVGMDVSHPPSQPAWKAREGESGEPSVVGIAWNTYKEPHLYNGDYALQASRLEEVADLRTLFVDALRRYSSGDPVRLPFAIFFYRDGVSDGQFRMSLEREGGEMESAIKEVGGSEYKPRLTQVVVMKRHDTRFFLQDTDPRAKPMDQNIPNGTVVDKEVVHAQLREFFLNSHTALQGTAKSPRYVVLRDDNGLSNDDLQQITYALCHDHQIISNAVSIPAPVYSAHNLAKRGKALREDGGEALLREFPAKLSISGCRLQNRAFWA